MRLHDILRSTAEKDPDKTALIWESEEWTYAEYYRRTRRLARALYALGIERHDRVCFVLKNQPEMVLSYFACFSLGAVSVPLYYRSGAREMEHTFTDCGCNLVIVEREFYSDVFKACSRCSRQIQLLVVNGKGLVGEDFETLLAKAPECIEWPEVKPSDPAAIIYTSGRTGKPKGVTHTHFSLYNTTVNRVITLQHQSPDRVLIVHLLSHMGAFAGLLLPCVFVGCTLMILPSFEPETFLEAVERLRPNFSGLINSQLYQVLENSKLASTDVSSLKLFLGGGEKVPMELHQKFEEVFGFQITEICGMTESSCFAANPPYGRKKIGSIGKAAHGTKLALINSEGRPVEKGQTGQIVVQSKAVMAGYWNDPEKTDEVIKDGWLLTGDLGREDEDGYFWFVGRLKAMITVYKEGGHRISPDELEAVICEHPQVAHCAVIGIPGPNTIIVLKAFVVCEKGGGRKPSGKELQDFLSSKLAAYSIPELWEFVDALPTTASGKIDRNALV